MALTGSWARHGSGRPNARASERERRSIARRRGRRLRRQRARVRPKRFRGAARASRSRPALRRAPDRPRGETARDDLRAGTSRGPGAPDGCVLARAWIRRHGGPGGGRPCRPAGALRVGRPRTAGDASAVGAGRLARRGNRVDRGVAGRSEPRADGAGRAGADLGTVGGPACSDLRGSSVLQDGGRVAAVRRRGPSDARPRGALPAQRAGAARSGSTTTVDAARGRRTGARLGCALRRASEGAAHVRGDAGIRRQGRRCAARDGLHRPAARVARARAASPPGRRRRPLRPRRRGDREATGRRAPARRALQAARSEPDSRLDRPRRPSSRQRRAGRQTRTCSSTGPTRA